METRLSFKADQTRLESSPARGRAKITAKPKIRNGKTAAVSFDSSASPNKNRDVTIHNFPILDFSIDDFPPLRKLRYARKLPSRNKDMSISLAEESQATFSTCTGWSPKRIAATAATLRLSLNFPTTTKTR